MKLHPFTLLLPAALVSFGLTAEAQTASRSNPTQITTTDGRVYNQATILRSDPDGLLVSYQPEQPGIGLAKVKFQQLPESLRNQYGYNAEQAAKFEAQQAQATAQWQSQFAAGDSIRQLRNLPELHRSLAGDVLSSYSLTLDSNGKVQTQGFTGNVSPYYNYYPPYSYYYVPGSRTDTGVHPAREGDAVTRPGTGYLGR
ncbi:MAG TPA: hypothetical protein VNZ22_01085 [Bacillota bacterium]|nr:hypothetical protein [Bacillota bacterium]